MFLRFPLALIRLLGGSWKSETMEVSLEICTNKLVNSITRRDVEVDETMNEALNAIDKRKFRQFGILFLPNFVVALKPTYPFLLNSMISKFNSREEQRVGGKCTRINYLQRKSFILSMKTFICYFIKLFLGVDHISFRGL